MMCLINHSRKSCLIVDNKLTKPPTKADDKRWWQAEKALKGKDQKDNHFKLILSIFLSRLNSKIVAHFIRVPMDVLKGGS